MNSTTSNINSVVVKIKTDRPVQKTPYQVKGVLMKTFPNEEIVPMLNGSYRKKYLYPRIQVKILDEEILIVGLNQGVEPILKIQEKIKDLNFGDITFEVLDKSVFEESEAFMFTSSLQKYEFVSNWVALNANTSKQFDAKNDKDKLQFLNNLLAKNIVFISQDIGFELPENIYSQIIVSSLEATKMDQNGWRAFDGKFSTNLVMPDYLGIGNGITRGFGTISNAGVHEIGLFDSNEFNLLKSEAKNSDFCLEEGNFTSTLYESDISTINKPTPRRKKKKRISKKKRYTSKQKNSRSKDEKKTNGQSNDSVNYNSYEYHKKQHSI